MPFFATVSKDRKLDASDADFVDVIHTNALLEGKMEASGDVDFYVNGGIIQPGCWSDPSKVDNWYNPETVRGLFCRRGPPRFD
jgi:hypothetical protein